MPDNSSDLLQLWNAAVPIQNARQHFAPPELAKQFEEHGNVSLFEAFQEQSRASIESGKFGIEELNKAMQATMPTSE